MSDSVLNIEYTDVRVKKYSYYLQGIYNLVGKD